MPTPTHLPARDSRSLLRPARIVLAAVLLSILPAARSGAAEDLNRIILRVNEEILTLFEYEQRKATEITTILSNPRIDPADRQQMLEQVGQLVVQSSFSEMLLLSFANQQSIRVTDAEVQDSVKQLIERQGIESEAELQQALGANNMTIEDLRNNARRELLWQRVVGREVQPRVTIDDEELRAYYRNHQEEFRTPEQRWLKEVIVLESSGGDDAEQLAAAQEIRAALAAGGDLDEIVAPYEERQVSTGVIDLEWLRADELESSLSEAAWALSPGEFSQPVAARGGYHILHVAGLREATVKPLSEVEDLIRRREYNSRFSRELRVFLKELEDQSYVQEDLPAEAVGYRALASDLETEDELELFRAPVLEPPREEAAESSGDGG